MTRHLDMFCSEPFTDELDFFTLYFHFYLYLKIIISIIFYILSLWILFETKFLANGALDPFKNLLHSSPKNKFCITGELTAPWVKSLFILYSKIFLWFLATYTTLHLSNNWGGRNSSGRWDFITLLFVLSILSVKEIWS